MLKPVNMGNKVVSCKDNNVLNDGGGQILDQTEVTKEERIVES